MKHLFEDWEDMWVALLFALAIVFSGVVVKMITADHHVRYYYLTGYDNILKIRGDIDWGEDACVPLDRAVTYTEAIQMVNELNKTLK